MKLSWAVLLLNVCNCAEVSVATGDDWTALVQSTPTSSDEVSFELSTDDTKNFKYTVPDKVQNWELSKDVCWVS